MVSIRGATQLDSDTKSEMQEKVCELVSALFMRNGLQDDEIVHILFTITEDLKTYNPAAALRRDGYANIPLFSMLEPTIQGMLPRVIRVLVTVDKPRTTDIKHVYLYGAAELRPDLLQ